MSESPLNPKQTSPSSSELTEKKSKSRPKVVETQPLENQTSPSSSELTEKKSKSRPKVMPQKEVSVQHLENNETLRIDLESPIDYLNHFNHPQENNNNNNPQHTFTQVEPVGGYHTTPIIDDYASLLAQPLSSPMIYQIIRQWKDDSGCTVTIEEFTGNYLNWNTLAQLPGRTFRRVLIEVVKDSSIRIESGAMHYMLGQEMTIDAKITGSSFLQGAIRPKITGQGTIWLQGHFHWYVVLDMDRLHNQIVVESGFFWACQGTISIKLKKISAKGSVVGDADLFHSKLKGSGWVILRIPVPESGIQRITIKEGQKLKMDFNPDHMRANDVLFRTGGVSYSADFAGKGTMQKVFNTSNEGILRTYTGSGEVWVMPTLHYNHGTTLL